MAWRVPNQQKRQSFASNQTNNNANNLPNNSGFNPATSNGLPRSFSQHSNNQSVNQRPIQHEASSGSRPMSTSHMHHSTSPSANQSYTSSPFKSFDRSINQPYDQPLHSAPHRLHNQANNQEPSPRQSLQLSPVWNPSMSPLLSPQSPTSPMPSAIHRSVKRSVNRNLDRQKRAFNFTPSHKSITESSDQYHSSDHLSNNQSVYSFKQSPIPHMSYSVHNGQMTEFDLENPSVSQPLISQSKKQSITRTKKVQRHRLRSALKLCCCCGRVFDRLIDRVLHQLPLSSISQSVSQIGRRKHLLPHASQSKQRVIPTSICLIVCLFGSLICLLIVLYSLLINRSINPDVSQSGHSASKYNIPRNLPVWLHSVDQDPHSAFSLPPRSYLSNQLINPSISQSTNPSMLIFTVMRDFSPEFSESNAVEYHAYEMALTSWIQSITQSASHFSKVLIAVFVDHADSCPFLESLSIDLAIKQSNQSSGSSINQSNIRCHVITGIHSEYKRPYLDRIWKEVRSNYQTNNHFFDYYTFVNGDILLFPDFFQTTNFIHQSLNQSMIVARRRDASFVPLSKSSFAINRASNPPINRLINTHTAFARGQVHDAFGIDVFIMRSNLFGWLVDRFPAFLVGVYRWDNWLLASVLKVSATNDQSIAKPMTRTLFGPVIDATASLVVGHSDLVSDHLNARARAWNDELCKKLIGQHYRVGSIDNVNWKIVIKPSSEQSNEQSTYIPLNLDADLSIIRSVSQLMINPDPRLPLLLWRHAYIGPYIDQSNKQSNNQLDMYSAIAFVPFYSSHVDRPIDQSISPVDQSSGLSGWLCQSESILFNNQLIITNSARAYWTMFMHGMTNMIYVDRSINQTTSLPALLLSLMRQTIESGVHVLLLDSSSLLLEHPLLRVNSACDSVSSSPFSSRHLMLTSMPRSDHTWNLVKKVDQCLMLDVDDQMNDRTLDQIDQANDQQFHECLSDVTRSAFMPLPSFTSCVNDRVQTTEQQVVTRFIDRSTDQSIDQSNVHSSPWPLAIIDRSTVDRSCVSPFHRTLQNALCSSCSLLSTLPYTSINPLIDQSSKAVNPNPPLRIVLHVHVRSTATEREIRLFVRSLLFADYESSLTDLTIVFDVHSLPHSNPPKPSELATRFDAILDEFETDFPTYIKLMPTYSHLSARHEMYTSFLTFEHSNEEYRAVWGRDNDWHLFVDSGYALLPEWHRWSLLALRQHWDERTFGVDIVARELPASMITSSTSSTHMWKGARVDPQRALIGLLISSHAAHFFTHYQQSNPDCTSTYATLQRLLLEHGMHIIHTTSLEIKAMNEAQKQTNQIALLNSKDEIIQYAQTLPKQLIWWATIQNDKCTFE